MFSIASSRGQAYPEVGTSAKSFWGKKVFELSFRYVKTLGGKVGSGVRER